MSLETFISNKEVKKMDGVYCCFFYQSNLVLLSNPPSDLLPIGKAEGNFDLDDQLIPLNLKQMSVVGGGVRYPENEVLTRERQNYFLIQNLLREVEEESGLNLELQRLRPLDGDHIRVIQSRNGKGIFDINTFGYSYELTTQEFENLIDYAIFHNRDAVVGTLSELIQADHFSLRPFAFGVLSMLAKLNEHEI